MSENQDPDNSEENGLHVNSLEPYKIGFPTPGESILHENLDKTCLYKLNDDFVRIEYPGCVRNVNKAIDSLGGIGEIQTALDKKRLELSFHPRNKYMVGCSADMTQSLGILIKVSQSTENVSYEILGASVTCFKFNRMCDFQYLPLIVKDKTESKESDVEFIYNKIVLDKIPTLEWFTKKESDLNSLFLVSGKFARFDLPQGKFQTNTFDAFSSIVRPDAPLTVDNRKKLGKKPFIPSIRVSLFRNTTVPSAPIPEALENVKSKFLQKYLARVKNLFDERPIWTKSGIMHKANILSDSAKHILPCLAYYCLSGPWRTCWIRFDYNPTADFNSRIYQVLDYRIRSNELQLKVKAKRRSVPSISKDFLKGKDHNLAINERNYILKPHQLPPARQMFYQYCDILLPDIQEMLAKLPKLPSTAKFDSKLGWLPLSFQEHCREIVTRYIGETVQEEMLKEARERQAKEKYDDVTTYCSKMLSNIKKGFSQSIGEYSRPGPSQENIIDEIHLSDDEEIDANTVVNSLPERLPENFEDEDEDSDLEIDMEAVEEVNELVAGIKDLRES